MSNIRFKLVLRSRSTQDFAACAASRVGAFEVYIVAAIQKRPMNDFAAATAGQMLMVHVLISVEP